MDSGLYTYLMSTPERDLTSYVSAYAPLLAVCVAVGVGIMQAYLQHKNLKQALYERRFKVYRSVIAFWHELTESRGAVSMEILNLFLAEISHAKFLFGSDVITFLEEYYGVADSLQKIVVAQKSATLRREVLPASKSEIDALFEQLDRLAGTVNADVFRRYLQLYDQTGWFGRCKARIDRWMDSSDAKLDSRYR